MVTLMTGNPLGEFVTRERERLGLNQSEFARRSGLSLSYLRQIEEGENPKTGRPISPTLDKISLLSKVLRVPAEALVRIALGEPVDRVLEAVGGSVAGIAFIIPEDIPEDVDDWERSAMERIKAWDWGDLDPRRDETFWYNERADRRRLFRFWEAQAEEQAELRRKRGLA